MNKNDANVGQAKELLWDVVVAGTLLTRLPLPHAPKSAFERQENSVWAFPVIGLLIGLFAALSGAIAFGLGLSAMITAGIMLGVTVVLTGAMHEDGLADCADGFWGGFDPARRLEIMKDSQIGTYGVLALLIIVGLRWLALSAVISTGFAGVIAAAMLSRGVLPALMSLLVHARETGLSHSVGRPPQSLALAAFGLASLFALFLIGTSAFGAIVVTALIAIAAAKLAKIKIDGQTGDVLGATQVLAETAVLLWLVL
jgi:adenosylcobinamide-GDP ribazoletransferase